MDARRQRLRLSSFDYRSAGAYLVTVCTRGRVAVLSRIREGTLELTPAGAAVAGCWHDLPWHHAGLETDAFVVMPDHVHGIVWLPGAGQARPLHLSVVVGSFKACSSRRAGRALWQRGFHDRIVRNDVELRELRACVLQNPLRWSLRAEA